MNEALGRAGRWGCIRGLIGRCLVGKRFQIAANAKNSFQLAELSQLRDKSRAVHGVQWVLILDL